MVRIAYLAVLNFLLWTPSNAGADPLKVIVFPLNGPSKNTSLSWLGEGISISISDQIDGSGVKSMERSERVELVEKIDLPPGAQLSHASMIQVAQRASADLAIIGAYSGSEKNLKILVRVLNVKALKLSGEISANGPLSVLPQMENELAWLILANNGLEKSFSRKSFQEKMRTIPNTAFATYIQSFSAQSESDQLRLLMRAVDLYPNFPQAQFRIGSLYYHNGDCASAIPHLVQGSGKTGTYPEDQFMLGTCYLQGKLPEKAVQVFSRILRISRPYRVLNNLGVAYLQKGDDALAINVLLEAKNLAPSDSTVSLNLAIARHLQRNDSAARSVLEEAIKSDAENGMLHFLLGYLLKLQGDDAAASALAKAKNAGIDEEKLQQETPVTWTRLISTWE